MEMIKNTRDYFITSGGDLESDFIFLVFYSAREELKDPDEEFRSLCKIAPTIFVGEKRLLFGSTIDWKDVVDIVKERYPNKKIVMVGLCAGAYLSVIANSYINSDTCILFNPIYDLYPSNFDHQLVNHYVKIAEDVMDLKFRNLGGLISDKTSYYILTGSEWGDNMQTDLFEDRKNILKFKFPPPYEHTLPEQLKDNGKLSVVFNSILNKDYKHLHAMTNTPYN